MTLADAPTRGGVRERPATTQRVLALVQTGASGRLRILQYVPELEREGYRFDVIALEWPAPTPRELARIAQAAAAADIVFVQRVASTPLAAVLRAARTPYVFDIDDAYHFIRTGQMAAAEHPRTLGQRLRVRYRELARGSRYYTSRKRVLAHMIRGAATTIVGNEFLRNELTTSARDVVRLPTCVPVDAVPPKVHDEHEPIRIGWIGSQGNVGELELLEPVFRVLRARFGDRIRLTVVTAEPYASREIATDFLPWALDTERDSVLSFDIGVMPVQDTFHARGKCSFKAIQCMSYGVPVVISPVGMNTDVVEHGVNGMLAETADEWVDALTGLIESAGLRAEVGRAGFETVRLAYSSDVGLATLRPVLHALERGSHS
jgi:glycosyltransferase involved in cell wall biosynthesis